MIKKGLKGVETKGLKYHKKVELTEVEKEVLHLITEEFYTIKKIAQRRKTTLQAVYKIRDRLKEKGAFNTGLKRVEKVEPTHNKRDVRLHGQEFNIKILFQDNKYQELLEKSNTLFIDGNTIRLYKNSIEIYSGQSFFGKTENKSERKSLDYFQRFITRLEHDLKVILIKPRARNIRIVNQHYARGDSELSESAIENKKRIWIYAEEDGKLAFITDDSFGFKEDETVHPKTAKKDRGAVDKQVNDWRINNPPTNSELACFVAETTLQSKKVIETVSGLPETIKALENQIKSHLALINEYRKENINWRENKVKEIREELKEETKKKRFRFRLFKRNL